MFRHSFGIVPIRSMAALRNFIRQCHTQKNGSFSTESLRHMQNLIGKETTISREHLTPEIALHLITPECRLFHAEITSRADQVFESEPFWAFYWPGGQAISRYILDNSQWFANKRILDVGSGCGASSIAALICEAQYAKANDIDKVAGCATLMNASLNKIKMEKLFISSDNLIGSKIEEDVVFIGDLFYDEEIAEILLPWLKALHSTGKEIFIGDPGRHGLTNGRLAFMKKLITYELPENCCIENHGFRHVNVWKFQ